MKTAILGTGAYVPERVLTNAELAERLTVAEEWITEKTRIKERRVASPDEATSDMGSVAAQRALDAAEVDAADVDLVVLATSTGDQPMPATACLVQARIGALRAAAFDIDAVCTGFVYGLVTADSMLKSNPELRTALVIGADTYSRILDYTDRRTAILFGDGAGAVVLGKASHGEGLLASTLGSDGTRSEYVQIMAGGSRRPPSVETVESGGHYFRMRGRDVRNLADRVFPAVVSDLLTAARLDLSDIDMIVPHQANGAILEDLAETLNLGPRQMHLTVEHYGNTGAASVPITLDDAVRHGLVSTGETMVLVAFGGGMTWGGAVVRWTAPSPEGLR
ncbi:3-oxoacyl-ACP synthase III family protein [Phytoactinopolyspora endophytica]|uniref:3-oxoacyl-ACP synthase III family protein n=1 Tax=Phytoactinopolyspora endophytica TaxID=1642495 RepID=UPI00101D4182|nr:beta-ketoacyl-ACP synthase III [Phytoactinopolyspora endophytica]